MRFTEGVWMGVLGRRESKRPVKEASAAAVSASTERR